jgi:hypothetical protein
MTAPVLRIEAPSDAQIRYIRGLCDEHGHEFPEAVFSKAEASEIIAAILHRQYDPAFYALGAPTYYGADADDSDVPF